MKFVTVIGARPQFIKASSISRLVRLGTQFEEVIVHTGQHFDDNMSRIFFDELEIDEPRYNLGVSGGGHGAMTGRQLAGIEEILLKEKPDALLVYGDTNSTLAGALAAIKMHIPVAHVEAGLRSFNRRMPEEINRVLTDHVSHWLFTPTATATANLAREGVAASGVHEVGDVMYDVSLFFGARARATSRKVEELGLRPGNYVVATIHRAENTDDPVRLSSIFTALVRLSRGLPVVLPLHPRTRNVLDQAGHLAALGRGLHVLPPVSYLDMTRLVQDARFVATDSGGLQKEAFFHGIPCVTLRDETEWIELVQLGWNSLPRSLSSDDIEAAFSATLGADRVEGVKPYGNGHAADKVLSILKAGL